jgi:hypothetical protein
MQYTKISNQSANSIDKKNNANEKLIEPTHIHLYILASA